MAQQVIVTSTSSTSIKPLLETAIRSQLKLLQHGIKRTKERLALFEQQFRMTSEEFEYQLKGGEITENLDTIDWYMEIKALRLLEEQYRALQEAKLD